MIKNLIIKLKKYGFFISIIMCALLSNLFASSYNETDEIAKRTLSGVRFDIQPDAIEIKKAIISFGIIEVRFRDINHLKLILEECPLIEAEKVLLIRDKEAAEGTDLPYLGEEVRRCNIMQLRAKSPLNMVGDLGDCPYFICVPSGSDFSGLDGACKGFYAGEPDFAEKGHILIKYLENFRADLFSLRTRDARFLMTKNRERRVSSPELYPDFDTATPDLFWISTDEVNITDQDYISFFGDPIAYMAHSIRGLEMLEQELPGDKRVIRYVDPNLVAEGIYATEPLLVETKYVIRCDGDIFITGSLVLPERGIDILATGDIWRLSVRILLGNSYLSRAGRNSFAITIDSFLEEYTSQFAIDPEIIMELRKFWKSKGFNGV